MKKIILLILVTLIGTAFATEQGYFGVTKNTTVGQARLRIAGRMEVAESSPTINTPHIVMHGPNKRITVRDGAIVSTMTPHGFYGGEVVVSSITVSTMTASSATITNLTVSGVIGDPLTISGSSLTITGINSEVAIGNPDSGEQAIIIVKQTTDDTAQVRLETGIWGVDYLQLIGLGEDYTSSYNAFEGSSGLITSGAGYTEGIKLVTQEATAPIEIYTGAEYDDPRMVIGSDGIVTVYKELALDNSSMTMTNGSIEGVTKVVYDTNFSGDISEEGTRSWNMDDGTGQLTMSNGVVYQMGQELLFKAKMTGGAGLDGSIVAITGAVGQRPTIELADSDDVDLNKCTIGLLTQDINENANGYFTSFGYVRGIDTSMFSDGDILYLSTEAGVSTDTIPSPPARVIRVGRVIYSHATEGKIYVNINDTTRQIAVSSMTLLTDGETYATTLQAGTQTNNIVITLPTSTGTANQILTTDGSGNAFWETGLIGASSEFTEFFGYHWGASRIYGGIITDNGDGTVDITAGYGMVKSSTNHKIDYEPIALGDAPISSNTYITWSSSSSLEPADNAYNFLYYDSDIGGINVTTDFYADIDFHRDFTIGRVYRIGTEVIIRLCGTNAWNFNRRVQIFGDEVIGVTKKKGTMILSESPALDLGLAITEGVLHAEMVNRFTFNAFDSTDTNFTAWHRDGSSDWTQVSTDIVNNTQYDDGTGTLGTINNNKYAVHFIYGVHDGSVHSVYGQAGNYS